MRILLISPANSDLISNVSLPLGLLSIGTYLKSAGHEVVITDMAVRHKPLKKILNDFRPDICGISVRSSKSVRFAIDISAQIKKQLKNSIVVWGGPFCDNAPEKLFFDTGVIDILSFGEGEFTWLEIADAIRNKKPYENIKGIAFMSEGAVIRTQDRELADLSKIKAVDWTLVDVNSYVQYYFGSERLVYLYYAKGCPAKCTFCYNPGFHRSCYRKKSLDVFMQELKYLAEHYAIDSFYLADEVMFMNKAELYEFCDALDSSDYKFNWGGQTRIGMLDKKDMQRLYDSGFRWIDMGIESGSKRILGKIKKGIPYDRICTDFENCRETGIFSMTNFIIGFPGETIEDVRDSVRLAMKVKADTITFGQYCFNYNSEMGREIYEQYKHKLPDKLKDYNRNELYINTFPDYSLVPRRDRLIIQGYFMWKQLSKADYNIGKHSAELMKKHLRTVFTQIANVGIKHLPEALLRTFIPFVRFFFAANFCKKTLRKYSIEE